MAGDRIKGIVGIVALVLFVGAVVFLVTQDWGIILDPQSAADRVLASTDTPADPGNRTVRDFTVRPGDSAASVAEKLQSAGLIKNSLTFRLMAEGKGKAGELASGNFELSPSMRPSEILDVLASGKIKAGPLMTIPEGWRAEEIAERISAKGLGSADQFMTFVRTGRVDLQVLASRPSGATLEGYLFPDTYSTDAKTSADSIALRMIQQFDTRFTPEMRQKTQARGLTIHQMVTLGSIIEREAVVPSERPTMAGVFYNRLKLGMNLDTDPTVQYAITTVDRTSPVKYGWWKTDLTQQDLEVDSPYNTYKYPGLPPGPICDPGLASLTAAVEPESNDYLYFVARPDGTHAFARTLAEHNDNVAKYRR